MLRNETSEKILSVLRDHRLTIHAFNVEQNLKGPSYFTFTYKLNNLFKFAVTNGTSSGKLFGVTYCPGADLVVSHEASVDSTYSLQQTLKNWLDRVATDDEIPENLDDINALKELFFRELGSQVSDEDKAFTQAEADELRKRIEVLEAKLEEFAKQHKVSDRATRGMKEKLSESAMEVDTMTKRKWRLVGGGKILDAITALATNPAARKAIGQAVAGYLTGPKT